MRDDIIRAGSAWPAARIAGFLEQTVIPVRLGCLSSNGSPLICSLWYLFDGDAIWCATQESARIVTWLERDARCGFEVAPEQPPYRGVRGQGRATLSAADGPVVLEKLVDRYLGTRDTGFARWLLARSDREVAVRIDADWTTSWDFDERMSS